MTARVLAYPVWMWHWAEPGDPRVPWWQARRVLLPDDVRDAKRAAVAAFATQVNPLSDDPADAAILPPHVLARLTRDVEYVFELDPLEQPVAGSSSTRCVHEQRAQLLDQRGRAHVLGDDGCRAGGARLGLHRSCRNRR